MSINGEGDGGSSVSSSSHTASIANKIMEGSDQYQSLFPSALIYRVPEDLRKQNKSAYTPRLIAIGPLHRENPQLPKTMENVKMYYANCLFSRLVKGREVQDGDVIKYKALKHCVGKMKDYVDKAKKYYAEEVKLNDDEMMEMLVVDGCFILELLYCNHFDKGNAKAFNSSGGGDGQRRLDPIFDVISTGKIIKHDLLLLENQIPFFVLLELFNLTVERIPNRPHNYSLIGYVLSYFQDIMNPEGESSDTKTKPCCTSTCGDCLTITLGSSPNRSSTDFLPITIEPENVYHILHLLHFHYFPENKRRAAPISSISSELISASDLDYAGVKFVPGKGNNLFNVNFNDDKGPSWWSASAKFEIPTLNIHGPTEPLFRNLIAMEQCCPGIVQCFTSYAKFMDMLINSEKDVKVLTKAKVINNYLSTDKDVFDLFNNLSKEVVIGEFYFNDPCKRASDYGNRLWPQFMTSLKRTYFASPLKFIGFFLAVVVFGTQITQTVFLFK